MAAVTMKKVPPDVHALTETDHLPSVRHLRVQVITNSKGYVELNLNHRGLRIVPPETFQLTNTQVLRLDHNYVDYLPTMIAYLRGLRVLDLQRNVLVHLPETLVNCRHLAELRLTGNRLASLPRSFGGLKNLRILELGENQLEQLPHEVGLLHSLRTLDLHSNRLWHLPFSLQELRHLLNFNLSDNMFDHVPMVVTKITSLRALNLSRNRLGSLPLDFDGLKGLRELNLSHNKMISVSSVLVTFRHLKYLSLASNSLKFLPSQMSQLQNLRVLHLQGNDLRHVPSCLRRLRFYNVSSNRITAFSVEGMRTLVSLTASKNRLETVPRGLYKLKHLKFLSLDCNALVEIGEEIEHLKQLRVLNMAHNNLQALPKALHKLPLLQNFNIKGNYNLSKRKTKDRDAKEMEKRRKEKRKLLHRGGTLDLKDVDEDDDEDEGIGVSGGGKKPPKSYVDLLEWNSNMGKSSKHYHGGDAQPISGRSAKSLDDLTIGRTTKHRHSFKSHHQIAGELAGIGLDKNDKLMRNESLRKSVSKTQPSKLFVGRGVALPAGSRATTLKKMTSSNPFAQSNGKSRIGTEGNKIKEEEKKSKFNKSVKNLKELIFGKSKNKTKDDHVSRHIDTTLKTSNSVHLPLQFTMEEVNHGTRRSRTDSDVYSARNNMPLNGHGNDFGSFADERSYITEDNRYHGMTPRHMQDSTTGEWKSLSHGYGSWRSRTPMFREDDSNAPFDDHDEDLDNVRETKQSKKNKGINYFPFQNKSKLNKKKSYSSDTVASDFTYQKFGGRPDRAPSRQSSNASRYQKKNNGYVTRGNDRYSENSRQGSMPRPSSRSRWLGQWYGPDYESTAASHSGDETDWRSRDYSVREARASFATETTVPGQKRHHRHPRNHEHEYLSDYEYEYRPMDQFGRNLRRDYSSVESLPHHQGDPLGNVYYKPLSRKHMHSRLSEVSCKSDSHLNLQHRVETKYPKSSSFRNHGISKRAFSNRPRGRFGITNISEDEDAYSRDMCDDGEAGGYNSEGWVTDSFGIEADDTNFLESVDSDNGPGLERYVNKSKINSFRINKPRNKAVSDQLYRDCIDETDTNDFTESELEQDGEQLNSRQKLRRFFTLPRSKSFPEFDNVLTTNQPESEFQDQKPKTHTSVKSISQNSSMIRQKKPSTVKHIDDNFALKKKSGFSRSRSMDSLLQQANEDQRLPPFGMNMTPLPTSYGTLARTTLTKNNKEQMNSTDYTLLGVCNQIETMLNKNLLQPVIGFKGSHRFEDKTIQEKAKGIWRLGDSLNQDDEDDGINGNDENDNNKTLETTLEYSQPEMFKITSTGGQFVTCERPEVKVTVPAHCTSKVLQVTIQLLNISPILLTQAKQLNHFIDNIIAIGPVVYFYVNEKETLNSPASLTLPAPASVKGNHLAVLTIRRDNSCIPCNSAYRSSKLEVTVSAWHFVAKVAVITQAKCKYKACKSLEMLLQCFGVTQL